MFDIFVHEKRKNVVYDILRLKIISVEREHETPASVLVVLSRPYTRRIKTA